MTVDVVDMTTGEVVFMGGALTPDQVRARAQWVRDVTKSALAEGVDYGVIPGTGDKPALLKPGAEMLLLAAGLGFTMSKRDDADARGHHGVSYTCTVYRQDAIVAQCDGYAGYDERTFYTSAEDNERRERWNAARYNRPANPAKFTEYRAPWNTLVKIAQKRALVGATLNATAASGLFVADVDDYRADAVEVPTPEVETKISSDAGASTDDPTTENNPTDDIVVGRTKLVHDLNAASAPVTKAFNTWRRAQHYDWPPTSEEVVKKCADELDALTQRAREDAESYG
jgi:hypothetical protein